MADASKLKRKNRLGAPPPLEEASRNLDAPESVADLATAQDSSAAPAPRPDGRTRRRSKRTLQLNLKVSPSFDRLLREIADREDLLLAEVMEKALEHYRNSRTVAIK